MDYDILAQKLSKPILENLNNNLEKDNHKNIMFYCLLALTITILITVAVVYFNKDKSGTAIATQIKIDQEEKINSLNHELKSLKSKIHPWLNHTPV